ncbi:MULTISPECIES: transglutaminase-like domain-containing protein [unclassified Methanoculleus]|uniref:transglutaminase-like domain-containing protein n=1 Tax=unclassified Methanoculleus TaxID=2619537 RepID=UPI0025CE3686|nr:MULTISPECIES: transglutaminase-like domain-containing protein [unclassified Methanoculleus]
MVWSILNAILLLSVLIPQGHLIYDGGGADPGLSTAREVSVGEIGLLSASPDALRESSRDALLDRVGRTTFACVDGSPRLFPVGLNATLAYGVGDCTDLALLRAEVLRRNGIAARPVHGIMVWDAETFRTDALHVEVFGKGVAVHDWVELGDGRTMGAYEGDPGVRCVKTGDGVCFQPVFEVLGYL